MFIVPRRLKNPGYKALLPLSLSSGSKKKKKKIGEEGTTILIGRVKQ